nr:MAG TPA: hypothetical protein [Caudoviricetes sp.]
MHFGIQNLSYLKFHEPNLKYHKNFTTLQPKSQTK